MTAESSLLAGKVVDGDDEPLVATHACKGNVRHRYYVSRALQHGRSDTGLRIPARELESLVAGRLAQLLADPLELAAAMSIELTPALLTALPVRCEELSAQLGQRRPALVTTIVTRVQVAAAEISVICDLDALAGVLSVERLPDAPATVVLGCAARLTRLGRALRLVQDNGALPQATPDRSMVRLLVQARRWWAMLRTGETSASELAAREGVTASYLTRVVRLAFLAPAVTGAILAGRQRAGVTVASLTAEGGILPDWRAQAAALLPG